MTDNAKIILETINNSNDHLTAEEIFCTTVLSILKHSPKNILLIRIFLALFTDIIYF